ncbi:MULTISPECIES: ATP-binding protein [Methylobacterium]|nr:MULTISPECIES: ATP-binding protein [Methylobacterium]PIU06512.1 MAG: sensor histidine kinase [Methylobacterium sp. CG09_land_8_20_14_0_10_71_15]PIU16403.1 MAG: sensor histidine kinase [Methylobacterium sp. CG08_land_8_20_14_0_20_71_15]GBU16470.1 sensory histidine kinase in two-component system [Methylobacterium sp.]
MSADAVAPPAGGGSRRGALLIGSFVAMVLAALAGSHLAQGWALADLRRTAQSAVDLQAGVLRAEMQAQSALPLALAADPEIAAMLAPGAPARLVEEVDGRLRQIARATGSAVIYVIGTNGITVAASNAGEDGTFVGRDYAFRPYFRQAMSEGAGSQFALGTVSGRPGFYLSRRLAGGGGVVVIKIEFDGIEAAWRAAGEQVFVSDPRGIVLVTSAPEWRFRTLRPVPAEEQSRIRESLEFGAAPLEAMPFAPLSEGADLVRARDGGPERAMLLREAPVPGTDWRLSTLTPVAAAVERERRQGGIIALLATGLACTGLATLAGRRSRTRARLAEAAARREELEARVRERTQALSDANRQLRAEMEERRRSEAERERLGRELSQAGRLAALGQFAASLAHEINQPLAAIRSYADNAAILVGRGRAEEAAENVSAIGRLTDRIGTLTRQLKGFARRASGRREPVALAEILRNSLEMVAYRAGGSGTVLDVAGAPADLSVLGEGQRLEQVLVNLLQNALDAVEGRSGARVEVEVEADAPQRVAVEVRDNGPGIPEAVRAQIFDPFFTTKSDGLGLGLAIARGIVEECGGSLSVRAAEGGGSVFRMELARADLPAGPEPAATEAA